MAVSDEPESDAYQRRDQEFRERRDALRRLSDKIRRLKAELDSLNQRAPGQKAR